MGDVGGYGIADYLPRVPFLPKSPHAEIAFIFCGFLFLISDQSVKNLFADQSAKSFLRKKIVKKRTYSQIWTGEHHVAVWRPITTLPQNFD